MLNDKVQYALLEEDSTLIIGNPEAEKVITMVSNPYCQPCAKAHKELEWINGRDDIKLQVVFSADDEKKVKVASHLMSLQSERDNISLKQALDDWYEQKQKNYEDWAEQHPVTVEINAAALEKQREWCNSTKISGTPTIFINGRKLPQNYQPKDIKYFI
jgi:protein-disulfide isomerase